LGRLYALASPPDRHLLLEEFSIGQEGVPGWTGMGGELGARARAPLHIKLRVRSSDGRAAPFTLRLIRSGGVDMVVRGETPWERVLEAAPLSPGRREFFRVEITAPHRLLSNPIFVGVSA